MTTSPRKALWTEDEIRAATRGQLEGKAPRDTILDVAIDSRCVKPGDLFIALQGPNHDGHDFIADAFDNGAVLAIATHRPEGLDPARPLLLVEDSMAALEDLGQTGRLRATGKLLGVTGSVGKTGTKEALRIAFSALAPCFANAGSLNNHWGVPLSLAQLPPEARFGIFEMGMNAPGEIARLTRMVKPDLAVITAIAPSHIGYFDSEAEIADAKAEIFDGMGPEGIAILPRDSDHFPSLVAHARTTRLRRIHSFGSHAEADARLIDIEARRMGTRISAEIMGEAITYETGLFGHHLAINTLAVLAAVSALGGDLRQAADALAELAPLKGRGQRHAMPWGLIIDESYNASPAALSAALRTLSEVETGGRRIAVLGDMLELGHQSERLHAAAAKCVLRKNIDIVHACGPLMKHLHDALPEDRRGLWAPDSAALAARICDELQEGDVVMVKGSAGSRMDRVLAALRACEMEAA